MGSLIIVLVTSFAGLVYQVQSVAQDVSYIKEQLARLTSDYDKFADKEETYNLIMLLINSRPQDIGILLDRSRQLRSVSDDQQ